MSMIAVFIGRLFIAVIFLVSGVNKLIHVADTNAMIAAAGLPAGLAIPTGLFELLAGACLALGVATRLWSILLAVFVLLTILFFHREFVDPMQARSEEHTSELPVTNAHLVCRLLLEKKIQTTHIIK